MVLYVNNMVANSSLLEKGVTRSNGWKLMLDKFRQEIRCSILTVRVIDYRKNLTRELVDFPSLSL